MPPLKIMFTIAGLHPASGGPSRSVPELCGALGNLAVKVEVVAHDYGPACGPPQLPEGGNVRTVLVDCRAALQRRFQWSPRFVWVLRERCADFQPQLIHDTGLWLSTNRAAARLAKELRLPRVVSPRGMLSDWALRHRGWKKRVAWKLYQRKDLSRADLLHATSAAEAEDFRKLGLRQPTAVIPNGVEIPTAPATDSGWPASRRRTVLFLGRIHPVKGLLDLAKAWAQVRADGWRVVIAGRDEAGHQAELEAALRADGVARDFEFIGPVEGPARWELYREADLFVLPSRSENFGIVVAEALACGVPVIATRGAPWADLLAHHCGWWTQIGSEPLAAALRDALARSDDERRDMGRRGRRLVETGYAWSGIAAQMQAVYRWLLGRGPKPACVRE